MSSHASSKAHSAENAIALLVFDMGHVFIDFEWDIVCEGFRQRAAVDESRFAEVLKHLGSLGYERGLIRTPAFLSSMNELLQTDITEAEFTQLWNATFRENLEMARLFSSLRKTHPLYLLSNTNDNHYEFLQSTFNVARHFDELILSYEVGATKPDAAIYQEVVNRSGLAPSQCLFVDDLEVNVEAAAALGMQTICFRGVEPLKARLTELGLELEF
jgi:haloacid dehalogenase superfamily, subfamily IA, variant 3 with third motif having DD or ED